MEIHSIDTEAVIRAVQIARDAVILIDHNQRIVFTNDGANQMYGFKADEMIGQPLDLIIPPSAVETHRRHIHEFEKADASVRKMTERQEVSGRRKDGTVFPAMASIARFENQGKLMFAVIVNDITEIKEEEKRKIELALRRAALMQINLRINNFLKLDDVLNAILEQALDRLRIDVACILLFNRETATLDFTAGRGFKTEALRYTHLHPGQGLAGKALSENCIVQIADLHEHPEEFKTSSLFLDEGFVSYFAVPLLVKGETVGVLELFNRSRIDPDRDWLDFLKYLSGQAAISIHIAQLFTGLDLANKELMHAYDETIEGWSRALDLRDKETEGHTQRVTRLTMKLAAAMGFSDEELVNVRRGALLHDIGKMGVPDAILLKPGKLTDEEWVIMRRHPQFAYDMIHPIEYLRPAIDIPYCHHEKWDGTGYPRGLKGEEIPLAARIFAAVDIWDALTSDRPYRAAWPRQKVLDYIHSLSGTHLDPQVVEVFDSVITAQPDSTD